jgi:hypothetical protein
VEVPASSIVRWSRAAVLGAAMLVAGAVAHTSLGGLLPGAFALAALYGAVVVGCALLLGREAATARLVLMVVAGQVLIHTYLAATSGQRGSDLRPGPVASWWTHAVADGSAHPVMAAAYTLAAVGTGLWLAGGERALWTLIRLAVTKAADALARFADRLAGLWSLRPPTGQGRTRTETFDQAAPLGPVWSRGPVKRGPPAVPLAR